MKNETFTPERIKAEADAFFEWDGEDRSLVTTTSCLLFAQHIAGLMQARAAQPAPAGEREAVAWRMWSGKRWQFCYSDLHGKRGWEPLMTVAQHERILASWQRTQSAGVPDGWRLVPDYAGADEIVTALYRRFKDWSARGFSADDVTWCEVKADVLAMLAAAPAQPAAQDQGEVQRLREALEGQGNIVLTPQAVDVLAQCVAAHSYVLGALVNGRPDLALIEAKKWVDGFLDAASTGQEVKS